MKPEYDIFRIEKHGLTWLGPAVILDDAKMRIQQHCVREPGDYFIFDQSTGDRIRLKVQGLRAHQAPRQTSMLWVPLRRRREFV